MTKHLPLSVNSTRRCLSYSSANNIPSDHHVIEQSEAVLRLGNATTHDYVTVLQELAVSKLADAPQRAERLFLQFEKTNTIPSAECYECVIRTWARAAHEDPARVVIRAERWLWKPDNTIPTTACFNAFLDACSLGRGLKTNKHLVRQHAVKAQSILQYMLHHNVPCTVDTFNFVIRAWTRCRSSADVVERVMDVLHLFETYHAQDASVVPNSKSYAMVLDALAMKVKSKVNKQQSSHHSRSTTLDPSENGLEEIQMMERFLQQHSQEQYQNTNCYNTLIQAWANAAPIHADAPFQAEQVLQRLITLQDTTTEIKVDAVSYQLVMRTWLNSKLPHRATRIQWWLQQLWKEYEFAGRPSELLRPTTAIYNTVMRAYSDTGQPVQAERVFVELQKHETLTPNSESYNIVIRAWLILAEKGSHEALQHAVGWLRVLMEAEQQRHERMNLSTSVDLFSSILAACRHCAGLDTLDVAIEVFDRLRDSHHLTDSLHYSRLLQVGLLALSRSEHDETRETIVSQMLRDCCNDGLVSRPLIQELADGRIYATGWTARASAQLVEELLPDWPLPSSWSRNVRQEALLPQRHHLERCSFAVSRHRGPVVSLNHHEDASDATRHHLST